MENRDNLKRETIPDGSAASADQTLVVRCLSGDESAWDQIIRSYTRRIFAMSYRYTGHREEAEDLTQEIFIRIYQNLRSFRVDTGSFHHWVLRLSRNLIIDRYRQSRRFPQSWGSRELEMLPLEDNKGLSALRSVEQAEARRFVRKALNTLSPENKEAIVLRDLEGMGYQEMATLLGIPEGTVKSRISRARLALARQLSKSPVWRKTPVHICTRIAQVA